MKKFFSYFIPSLSTAVFTCVIIAILGLANNSYVTSVFELVLYCVVMTIAGTVGSVVRDIIKKKKEK